MGVALTHPYREFWPDADDGKAVTKEDLAYYFETVGAWMMPHIEGRPLSILRAPEGLGGQLFFQRHAEPHMDSFLKTMPLDGEAKPYFTVDSVEGLISLAQIAALELHPTNGRPGEPEVPGRLVFDLDPGPGVAFSIVTKAAHQLRDRLEVLNLVPFCKTTGGKGLHVVTPLMAPTTASSDWAMAKACAEEICARLAAEEPDLYIVNMAKKHRQHHIFLDYLRNDRMATAVAPLSPRAKPGAHVSMPLTWDQVTDDLDPKTFTLRTAPDLLGKAWADYHKAERPLDEALRRLGKLNFANG